jgi:hypothetical protein
MPTPLGDALRDVRRTTQAPAMPAYNVFLRRTPTPEPATVAAITRRILGTVATVSVVTSATGALVILFRFNALNGTGWEAVFRSGIDRLLLEGARTFMQTAWLAAVVGIALTVMVSFASRVGPPVVRLATAVKRKTTERVPNRVLAVFAIAVPVTGFVVLEPGRPVTVIVRTVAVLLGFWVYVRIVDALDLFLARRAPGRDLTHVARAARVGAAVLATVAFAMPTWVLALTVLVPAAIVVLATTSYVSHLKPVLRAWSAQGIPGALRSGGHFAAALLLVAAAVPAIGTALDTPTNYALVRVDAVGGKPFYAVPAGHDASGAVLVRVQPGAMTGHNVRVRVGRTVTIPSGRIRRVTTIATNLTLSRPARYTPVIWQTLAGPPSCLGPRRPCSIAPLAVTPSSKCDREREAACCTASSRRCRQGRASSPSR